MDSVAVYCSCFAYDFFGGGSRMTEWRNMERNRDSHQIHGHEPGMANINPFILPQM